jgi:hypothetical protein
MVDCENQMENRPPVSHEQELVVRTGSLYFLFWRIGQILLENLHLVPNSLGFRVPK